MARLPFAGGRQGMGTTAVENDFLKQLEEAYGAGDRDIDVALSPVPPPGESSVINPLAAMIVKQTRDETRKAAVEPPQATVREELAMNAMNQGLGSRPRSYQPPLTMAGGGVVPRYNDAGLTGLPGATVEVAEEEVDPSIARQLLDHYKENPGQAVATAISLGLMFVPIPGSRAVGIARLATSPAGRIATRVAKPVARKAKSAFDRVKAFRNKQGEKLGELGKSLPPKPVQPSVRDMATATTNPTAASNVITAAEQAAARRAAIETIGNQDLATKAALATGISSPLTFPIVSNLFSSDEEIPAEPVTNFGSPSPPPSPPEPRVGRLPIVEEEDESLELLDRQLSRIVANPMLPRRRHGGLIPRYNTAGLTGQGDEQLEEAVAAAVNPDGTFADAFGSAFMDTAKAPERVNIDTGIELTTIPEFSPTAGPDDSMPSKLRTGLDTLRSRAKSLADSVKTDAVDVSLDTSSIFGDRAPTKFAGSAGDEYLRSMLNPALAAERQKRSRATALLGAAGAFMSPTGLDGSGGIAGGLKALGAGAQAAADQDLRSRAATAQTAQALAALRSREGITQEQLGSQENIQRLSGALRERELKIAEQSRRDRAVQIGSAIEQAAAKLEADFATSTKNREADLTKSADTLRTSIALKEGEIQSAEKRAQMNANVQKGIAYLQQEGTAEGRLNALTRAQEAAARNDIAIAEMLMKRRELVSQLENLDAETAYYDVQRIVMQLESYDTALQNAEATALRRFGFPALGAGVEQMNKIYSINPNARGGRPVSYVEEALMFLKGQAGPSPVEDAFFAGRSR